MLTSVQKNKVHRCPVGLVVMPDGSPLVADDVNGVIWRVTADQ